MEMEEDTSQSGYLDGRESQSHNQGDEQKMQETNYSELYEGIIISIIEEHNKIQNLADLYDIVLSKIDESLQDTESYEDIDLDQLADECFKQLKVKLYDSFSKQIWQDKSTQNVSEYQKIEFIDDKLNESFDFFHTVSNLIVYLEQLQKQLMVGNKQINNKDSGSVQNSSEKENPTESINLRQRKNTAGATLVGHSSYEGKQIGDRQKQKDNIVNFSENKGATSASLSSSSRTTSKRGETKQNMNAPLSFGLQQSFCSNESLGMKGTNQNNLLAAGDFRNAIQGEQKIFVRLNPLNVQTHQIQLYLQNFPRLEVKYQLVSQLSPRILESEMAPEVAIQQFENWLIDFKGQEKPKLSEQLMINDIYSGFNYPKDQVVNLLYEITKDQPPQPAPSMLQVPEWESHIQNNMPSPRLHIPLSPSRLGVDHEDNYHFLQQFSQDSDFRFFNYYENLFNEDDDEDYVVNEDEEEEEEDDEDDEEDYEEDEEAAVVVVEEDQEQQDKANNVQKDDYQNQNQNDQNNNSNNNNNKQSQDNQQNFGKHQGEGEDQNKQLGQVAESGNQNNQKKKSNKNNKEDGFDQRQKSSNTQQSNKKNNEKRQKQINNNNYQNQQKMMQENSDLNNQYGNYGQNSDLNYNEYQSNLMDECKDNHLISNFEINEFGNVSQLNDFYSNQYKMQMNNRYRSQEDVDNTHQNDLHMQDQHHNNQSINLDNSMLKQNSLRNNNSLMPHDNLNNMTNNLSNMIGLGNLESQNFQKQMHQTNYDGFMDFNNDTSNNLNNNNNMMNNNLNEKNNNNNEGFISYSSNLMNQESNHIQQDHHQLDNGNNDNNSISLMINQQQNRQNQDQQIQNSLDNQNANPMVKSPQVMSKDKKKNKIQEKQTEKIKRQKQSSTVDQNPDEQIISLIKPNPYKDIEMFQKMKSKGNPNQNQSQQNEFQIGDGKTNSSENNSENDQKKNLPKNNIRPPSFQLNQTQKSKEDNEKEPKLQKFIKQNSSSGNNNNQDTAGVSGEQNYKMDQENQRKQINSDKNDAQQDLQNDQQQIQTNKQDQQQLQLNHQDQQSNTFNNNKQYQDEDFHDEEEDDDNEDEEDDDDDDEGEEEEFDEEYSNNQDENNQQNEKKEKSNEQNNQIQYNEQSQNLLKNTSPLQFKHNFSNFNLFNQDSYQFHNNQSYNFNSINNIFNTTSNANLQNPLFNQQLNNTNSNLVNKSLLKSPINPNQKKGGGYTFKQNIFGDKNFNSNNFQNDNSIMNLNSIHMRFEDPSSNFKQFDFPFSNMNYASNSRPFLNDKYTNNFTISKFNQNSNINSIPLYRNFQHSNQLNFGHNQFNHPLHSRRDIFADKTLSSEAEKDNQQIAEKAGSDEILSKTKFNDDKNFPSINIIKSESTPSLGLKSEQDQNQIKLEANDKEFSNQKQQQQSASQNTTSSEANKNEVMGFRKINVIKKEDSGVQNNILGKRFLSEQGESKKTQSKQDISENQTPSLSVLNTEKIENLVKQIVGNQQIQDISIQDNSHNNNNNQNDSQSYQDSLKYLQMNESNQDILMKNTSNNNNNNSSNIFKVRKLSVNQLQNQNSTNQSAVKSANNNSNSNFSKNVQEVHNAITNLLNNQGIASLNTNNSELSKESINSNNHSNTEIKENYKFLKFQNEFAKYYSENLSKIEDQKQSLSNSTQQPIKTQLMRIDSTKAVSAILENVIASQQLKTAQQTSQNMQNTSVIIKQEAQQENNNQQNSQSNIEKQQSLGASQSQLENIKQIIQIKTASKTVSPNYLSNMSDNNNIKNNDYSNNGSKQIASAQNLQTQQNQQQQVAARTDLQFLENLVELVGIKKNQAQNTQQLINQVKESQPTQNNNNNKQQNIEALPNKNILVKSISVVRKQNNNTAALPSQSINQNVDAKNNSKAANESDQNSEITNKNEQISQKSDSQNSNQTQ